MEEQLQVVDQVGRVDLNVVFLYVLAAIAGLFGGCGAGAIMVLTSKKNVRIAQFMAYAFIGAIAAMLMLGFGYMAGIQVHDTAGLIRWSVGAGVGVPIALFCQNLTISAVLRKFGWELQFTMRRGNENRRGGIDSDE